MKQSSFLVGDKVNPISDGQDPKSFHAEHFWLNPISQGVPILSHARGAIWYPTPLEIMEQVVLGPMLPYISWQYLEIELTCKKLGKNLKNWERFQDLKILRNWDFA